MTAHKTTFAMAGGNPEGTVLAFVLDLAPLDDVADDVSGLLGNFLFDLLVMFFPRPVASTTNVAVIEMVTAAMEHDANRSGALRLHFRIEGDTLEVVVEGPDPEDERRRARRDSIASAADPRKLLADTVSRRRIDRTKAALGLMRLMALSSMKKKPN